MQMINCNIEGHATIKIPSYDHDTCQRHIQLFGESMQSRMSQLTIGLGSVGGLGMVVLEQIMRLFPQKIILIDFDHIDISNLNRLLGATKADARLNTAKTDLAIRHVLNFNPDQDIFAIQGNFLDKEVQEEFKECDIFISTYDREGPRFSADHLCHAHGIILIDIGVGANVKNDKIQNVGGQIIKITPDSGFCLLCAGIYDIREAQADFMDSDELEHQQNMGYVRGANINAPQVYSINMMAASQAIWMLMQLVAGEKLDFDGIAIDALNHKTYTWKENSQQNKDCPVCGPNGIVFEGDKAELLTRDTDKDQEIISLDEIPEWLPSEKMTGSDYFYVDEKKLEARWKAREAIKSNSLTVAIPFGLDRWQQIMM